jgi:hypothetical protein
VVQVFDTKKDSNAYAKVGWQSNCSAASDTASDLRVVIAKLIDDYEVNEFAASMRVSAVKPTGSVDMVRAS